MASLMEALLAEEALRGGEQNVLLAGMTGRGGAYRDLPRSVLDPVTGKRQAFRAQTGEVVERAKVLPAGITDNGRLVPAMPDAIMNALKGVNTVGDVVAGKQDVLDPLTGAPDPKILDFAVRQGAGLLGNAIPQGQQGELQGLLAMLRDQRVRGSGPVVRNLGLGR